MDLFVGLPIMAVLLWALAYMVLGRRRDEREHVAANERESRCGHGILKWKQCVECRRAEFKSNTTVHSNHGTHELPTRENTAGCRAEDPTDAMIDAVYGPNAEPDAQGHLIIEDEEVKESSLSIVDFVKGHVMTAQAIQKALDECPAPPGGYGAEPIPASILVDQQRLNRMLINCRDVMARFGPEELPFMEGETVWITPDYKPGPFDDEVPPGPYIVESQPKWRANEGSWLYVRYKGEIGQKHNWLLCVRPKHLTRVDPNPEPKFAVGDHVRITEKGPNYPDHDLIVLRALDEGGPGFYYVMRCANNDTQRWTYHEDIIEKVGTSHDDSSAFTEMWRFRPEMWRSRPPKFKAGDRVLCNREGKDYPDMMLVVEKVERDAAAHSWLYYLRPGNLPEANLNFARWTLLECDLKPGCDCKATGKMFCGTCY